jgi:diguanylate cyclase (GGDEF)-like protein
VKAHLADKLSRDFLPLKIDIIKPLVPESYFANLKSKGVDIYFPIYWRDNLYGLYFVNSTKETRSAAFTLLIASLAHSLSAAYHIKWHESRLSGLEKISERPEARTPNVKATSESGKSMSKDLLPLVKIKDTEALTDKIVSSVGENLNFDKFCFIYRSENKSDGQRQLNKGLKNKFEMPDKDTLATLSDSLRKRGQVSISEFKGTTGSSAGWLNRLKKSGLDYISLFPAAGDGEGILAWSGPGLTDELKSGLSGYRRQAEDLLENAQAFHRAEMMSYTDALTGLTNQRYMYKRLEEEVNRSQRHSRTLAFVIFDIDELKSINDKFGHQAGDALIKQVGQALKKSIRAIDIVARYGGDEFCVVMPESDEATTLKFMKRMLDKIAGTDIKLEGIESPLRCTVSMGGALFPKHASDPRKLVYAADMALLKAKESGRNRFFVHSPVEVN